MKPIKPYKKFSETNRKKKKEHGVDSGVVSHVNSSKRFPIISLPEITTNPILQTYRRFLNANTAVNNDLAISNLLDQFLVALNTTTLITYIRAVRIKKIRMLCPVSTQGSSVTAKATPYGYDSSNNCFNAVPEVILDTSASIDVPAYIDLTPNLETPLGSWHYATTIDKALLSLECPIGTTMDILFEYILAVTADAQPPSPYSVAVAGATVGALYARSLIGLTPVGVNVI